MKLVILLFCAAFLCFAFASRAELLRLSGAVNRRKNHE
jgi:hypothetical protein